LLLAFPECWSRSVDVCDRTYFRGLWNLHSRRWSHHATEFPVHSTEFHGGLEEHHRVLPQRGDCCHRRDCSQGPHLLADIAANPRHHNRGGEWSVDDDIVWHGKRAIS